MDRLCIVAVLALCVSSSQVLLSGDIGAPVEVLESMDTVGMDVAYAGLMQISNDHSGRDNQGFQDVDKMMVTWIFTGFCCLAAVFGVQYMLSFVIHIQSKQCRYELVKLRKNYYNLKMANRLRADE